MHWAEWILRQIISPSRPARRMPRLAVLPLEDRAVPHAGHEHPVEPAPADVTVVQEETPTPPPAPTDAGETTTTPPDVIKGEEAPEPRPAPTDAGTPTDAPPPAPAPADGGEPRETPPPDVVKGEPVPEDEQIYTTTVVDPEDVRRDADEEEGNLDDDPPVQTVTTTAPPAQPKAPFPQIGNKVWKDLNADGLQDPGEPGVAFVTLHLYQGAKLVGTTTTNGLGEFAFNRWNVTNGTADTADDGLKANTAYQIRVAGNQPTLTGLRPTAANQGTGNPGELADSDATATATGAVLDLTLGAEELYPNYDLGYTTAASVGNLVWHDVNNNGKKDKAEDGLPGVTVRLLDDTGKTQVATTITGDDGSYLFTGLLPGTYVVEVASNNFAAGGALAGVASSTGAPGKPGGPLEGQGTPVPDAKTDGTDTGMLVSGAVRCKPVTVGEGGVMETKAVDFGFFHSSTITGKVFIDKNANGRIDPEDTAGLANVRVRVSGPAGTYMTTTDASGTYTFAAVPAGAYTVTELIQPAGYRNSTPNLSTTSVAGGGTARVNFGEARLADLRLGQVASQAMVGAGGILTLTYRLKNLGTLDATGVVVTAALPAGLTVLGSEVTGTVKYDAATQRINVGTLAGGAEVVVKVRVRSTKPGAVLLRATVQANEAEDNVKNNAAAVVVTTTPGAVAKSLAATGGTSAWMLGSGRR